LRMGAQNVHHHRRAELRQAWQEQSTVDLASRTTRLARSSDADRDAAMVEKNNTPIAELAEKTG
jgi:hypothetical protein